MRPRRFTPAQALLVALTREGRMVTDVVNARCMEAHGARGARRHAKKLRHRASARRRELVASRSATVAINTHGIYIEPRTTPRDRVAAFLGR